MTDNAKANRDRRSARDRARERTEHWRRTSRAQLLLLAAIRTARCPWSADLLHALLDELYAEEDVVALLGDVDQMPTEMYPQAVAVALAVRHSWRPDDLANVAKRLGVSLRPTTREMLPPKPRSTSHGHSRCRKQLGNSKKRHHRRLWDPNSRPNPCDPGCSALYLETTL